MEAKVALQIRNVEPYEILAKNMAECGFRYVAFAFSDETSVGSGFPVLVLLLGTCPTLALTSSATNGFGMGIATTCVLIGSNFVISLIASITPKKIRIPVYIVVIAAFVTVVDLLLQAYAPAALYEALGIFIPLIKLGIPDSAVPSILEAML